RRRRIAAHRTCMIAAFAASSLFLINLPDPPRPGGLGPFPRSAVAAPRLLRASRPTYRAGSVGGAACATDPLPSPVRALRPPRAARACDAAPLALRLDQRRSGVCPPLPLRSLNPTFFGTQVPAYGSCHCPSFV